MALSSLRFRVAAVTLGLAATGALGATACGAGFLDGLTGGTRDAGEGPSDVVTSPLGCVGLVPPDGSTGEDGPSIDPITVVFSAMRLTPVAESAAVAPQPVGFNLDHLCTCGGDRPACITPDAGLNQSVCDGDGGTDDGLATFFALLGSAFPEFQADFASKRISEGIFSVILDVFNWNGQPEDPQVLVRLRMSTGIDQAVTGKREPRNDGKDVWLVDPGTILQGDQNVGKDCRLGQDTGGAICSPTTLDAHAFVTGGHLIAHLQDSTGHTSLLLGSTVGRIAITLTDSTLDATLARGGDGLWRMTGQLTGRWSAESILNAIGNIENPLVPNTPICATASAPSSVYATVKPGVCGNLDIAATPTFDSDPSHVCDAVSSAISFSALTATPGHVAAGPPLTTECVSWKDDCGH